MATIYDLIDMEWLPSGDLTLGIFPPENRLLITSTRNLIVTSKNDLGGISSTETDQIQGFVQLIDTWLQADPGDWRDTPDVGVGLYEFIGKPNSRETAELIKQKIFNGLTQAGIVRSGDLEVDITPIDIHSILIMLHIKARPTSNNSLTQDTISIGYSFNIGERNIVPLGIVTSS